MSFSVPAFMNGPESLTEMDIPGFPKAAKPEGFASSLQGHLEKLSANAKSIHHVLEALCSGLDRLERKIDTNSSLMDTRLENIVHHMTGEADEDTMSAWGSLGGVGSPAELGLSLARRSGPFGLQMASFNKAPDLELDGNLDVGGKGTDVVNELVVARVKPGKEMTPERERRGGGGREEKEEEQEGVQIDGDAIGTDNGEDAVSGSIQLGDEAEAEDEQVWKSPPEPRATPAVSATKTPPAVSVTKTPPAELVPQAPPAVPVPQTPPVASVPQAPPPAPSVQDGAIAVKEDGFDVDDAVSKEPEGRPTSKTSDVEAPASAGEPRQEAAKELRHQLADNSPRRRSNQDDHSVASNSSVNSAREDASVLKPTSPTTANAPAENPADAPPVSDLQGSVTSGGSDVRYIARQRWIWAFGRVCQLIRRRKRKQFEIMSQRATDRTVRMGSRVSVVEKRLDEAHESLLRLDRLGDKALLHTDEIKNINQKVAELSALLGVEERVSGRLQVAQEHMERMVKSGETSLESRRRSGHDKLEARLDAETKLHGARMEHMEDRYARSEYALRQAEERMGDMQDEVTTVTHSIAELERQLRVDEERLDNLDSLKKAHQRRLSELRVQLEGVPTGGVLLEPEPEETGAERRARLLKSAGTAAEFLANDLDTIVSKSTATATTASTAEKAKNNPPRIVDTMEQLQHIRVEAAEFSRRCTTGWAADGVDGDQNAVEGAEALCARIENTLSAGGDNITSAPPDDRRTSVGNTWRSDTTPLRQILCPNGRRDLPLRLAAARDALLPVVGEWTSVGSLKVALLGLKANLKTNHEQASAADLLESRWRDLHGQVAALDTSVANITDTLCDRNTDHENGIGRKEGRGVDPKDLEEKLSFKADLSWVQRELQRIWDALDSRTMAAIATSGKESDEQAADSFRPKSAPLRHSRKENPETAGEESDTSSPPPTRAMGLGANGDSAADVGGGGAHTDHWRRSSFNESSSLIKDLLRKTSRLEQQMVSKADNDEVMRALSSVGVKMRKMASSLPMIEDALSNKIERKDLNKLAALISNAGNGDAPPGGHGGARNDDVTSNPAVLASRLNSKFRCLSCDRPLPALGPPGAPKLGTTGLSIAGAGTPRSPQRISRPRLTPAGNMGSSSRPSSPTSPTSSPAETGDFAGWGGSSRVTPASADDLLQASPGTTFGSTTTTGKDTGRRRRLGGGGSSSSGGSLGSPGDQPGRLEPIGANAPGEQIAGVMSRYPRMMPPPSRIRTAAGGGGAGIGSRPGSSLGAGWA